MPFGTFKTWQYKTDQQGIPPKAQAKEKKKKKKNKKKKALQQKTFNKKKKPEELAKPFMNKYWL